MPKIDELRQRFAVGEAEAREAAKRKAQEEAEREAQAQLEREAAEADEERRRRDEQDAHVNRDAIRAAREAARDRRFKSVGLGRARWAETKDGDGDEDALLQFGKYSGRTVSQLCYDATTLDYLRWLYRADFPERLKQIVFEQLTKRAARV